ncbi:WG repeat-containing protein [Moraxella nasicaprae]|nr:WG repeat-containing protein [Moraxella nasicaprae]
MDTADKLMVAVWYDDVWDFDENLAKVKQSGKAGFIDNTD